MKHRPAFVSRPSEPHPSFHHTTKGTKMAKKHIVVDDDSKKKAVSHRLDNLWKCESFL